MDWRSSLAKSLCIAVVTLSMGEAAHAATLRAFVSGVGDNINTASNCSHAAPCRTFAAALTVVSPGGEIVALDPAGYGPITIDRPLTLVGVPGAAINVPSAGTGIAINAGPNDSVRVQGLLIDGGLVGYEGIEVANVGSLSIEKCVVRNLINGIDFNNLASITNLMIADSTFENNSGDGILIDPFDTVRATAVLTRVNVSKNHFDGIVVTGSPFGQTFVTVSDSVIDGNDGAGARAASDNVTTVVTVFRSVMANNGTGFTADGGFTALVVGQSEITGNANGWTATNGALVQSYNDNKMNWNTANEGALPLINNK